MNFILQSLIAFLPREYRRKLLHGGEVSPNAAIASGVVQCVIFFDLLMHYYFSFAHHWLGSVPEEVSYGAYSSAGETGMMGVGVFLLVAFVLQPLTLFLLYLVIEGVSRVLGVVFSGEVRGSLLIWLVAVAREKLEARKEEAKLGPRIADAVEKISGEADGLRIASCRPKADWDDRVTIAYQQGLYEIAGQETGVAPRPFVYVLRHKPEYKVIRGLRHYAPDEVLRR
jgi:hypothetical protein